MLGPDDIIYKNRYVWTRYKNELNKRKHHLSFETASLVFDDPFLIEEFDDENSITEVIDYYEQFQKYLDGQNED